MTTVDTNAAYRDQIREAKRLLRANMPDLKERFALLTRRLEASVAEVQAIRARGDSPVPTVNAAELDSVSDETKALIRQRGCVVIKGVFNSVQIDQWNASIATYLTDLDYLGKADSKRGIDQDFSALSSSKPQIYSVYWSPAQVQVRQSQALARARQWLNRLWDCAQGNDQPVFDPDQECIYADRVRQREPGDDTLGLSPHVDGGSIERWIDPGYQAVYRHVYGGDINAYQAFAAAHRTQTKEIPSPAVCQMFRTYQGWTALTRQGPGDGTLNLRPIADAMPWMLLRALQDDIADDDLCGAQAGRALMVNAQHHALLMQAYGPIPQVEAGDTVWWHPDVIHGVEDKHNGTGYSNVIYTGAAPRCAKNESFLATQRAAFERGESSPDFAPEHYELDFAGRAMPALLTALGRQQMGYIN